MENIKLEIKHQKTKTLSIKENGRSSDYVTPNFILSCNAGCLYCYTYRFGRNKVYVNNNVNEILEVIRQHSLKLGTKIPNQTDEKYFTYDIGCDTDLNYHWNDYDWNKVLKFFTETPNIKATFATKFVNKQLLPYGNEKLRMRFSLMPQNISSILEKGTSLITQRIRNIDTFIDSGWDIHLNFSPVVYYKDWLKDYEKLFIEIDQTVKHKDKIKCEVIFLTHNDYLHNKNLENNLIEGESLLWRPELQETKISQYGGKNIRYKWDLKEELINDFKQLHNKIISYCDIRYIF
jgi:spore photoproduct lyase